MRPIGIGLGVGFIAGAAAGVTPVAAWDASTSTLAQLTALIGASRPSLATMFDSTGKLTYAPNNLLLNSGTLSTQSITVQVGTNYLVSFASGAGSIALSGAGAGTVTSASAVKVTASTTTLTLTVTGTVTNAVVAAVTYEATPRTADQVITTASAYYGPRVDYDPNTLAVKGLLIEENRTNLVIQSGFASAWSAIGVTAGADATTDLTGATAKKISVNAGASTHNYFLTGPLAVSASTAYAESWFVKAGTHSKILINVGDGTRYSAAVFDVSGTSDSVATQVASAGDTSVSGVSKYFGNGWFRLTLLFTTATGSVSRYFEVAAVNALTGNTFSGYGENSWTAAGTETFYVGQPQLEPGSFPTSYIPTATSSVTRAADVVQFTGTALTALQGSAGSAIIQSISLNGSSPTAITNLIRGTNSILYRDTTGKTGTTNGTTALLTATAPTWNAALRNGLAWSGTGRSLVFTGGAVATDANAVSNGGTLYLGSNNGSAVENGWYQSFAIYNQRLPDATLQAKSVVGASY